MKTNLFFALTVLILVNFLAGLVLYYVYFPWVSAYEQNKVIQTANSDIRKFNFSLSMSEYTTSQKIIAEAIHEFNVEVIEQELKDTELDEEKIKQLKKKQYLLDYDNNNAPTGYILLNNNDRVVKIGPYPDEYNNLKLFDLLIYISILALLNGIYLFGINKLLSRQMLKGISALDTAQLKNVHLLRHKEPLSDIVNNLPTLVNHIDRLSEVYKISLSNQRDLMHAVAHEFRGPLARINFASDLFINESNGDKLNKLKNDIQDSIDELDLLVKEVLDYSQLKDGRKPLDLNSVNIKTLAEQTLAKVVDIYKDRRFSIDCEPTQGFNCITDESLTERALLNLIRNAAKFSKAKIHISIKKSETELFVFVEDDGMGIPPGKREHIFEPFTRLEYSRNRDSGGAGLGLSIVKGAVESQKGTVSASSSKLLGGAKFSITLPLE